MSQKSIKRIKKHNMERGQRAYVDGLFLAMKAQMGRYESLPKDQAALSSLAWSAAELSREIHDLLCAGQGTTSSEESCLSA